MNKQLIVFGICVMVLLVIVGCKPVFDEVHEEFNEIADVIESRDFDNCNQFNGDDKDICVSNIAMHLAFENKDASYCDMITSPDIDIELCKQQVNVEVDYELMAYYNAIENNDSKYCDDIKEIQLNMDCWSFFGIEKRKVIGGEQ